MRTVSCLIAALLALTGCSVFKTPEPDLFRTATVTISGTTLEEPFGIAYREGHLYVSDGASGSIHKISESGGSTPYAQGLGTPSHIAFDADGYLLVADSGTHTIKRVRAGGDVEVVAGVEGKAGFADGATSEALFRAPVGIAVVDGQIYVADTYNDRIRVVRNGQVFTVAGGVRGFTDGIAGDARFDTPTGIAVTKDKRILVADSGNRAIRSMDGSGAVTTVIGSMTAGAQQPELAGPSAFVLSEKGDIFFTDGDSVKRMRHEDGAVETVSETVRGYTDSSQSEPRRFNRPTGLAIGSDGALYVADSENRAVRVFSKSRGKVLTKEEIEATAGTAVDFKAAAVGRWPYEPGSAQRDIAGTFGEIRGAIDAMENGVYFHNGLDISGGYGERAYFIRTEKVLRPIAADNFGTLREYLRMPTLGYVHIRLGRDKDERPFGDPRFIFDQADGTIIDVRVPRGSVFQAGESIGTLNAMNHVHLVVGRSGQELNGLAALDLPGVSDGIAPIIERIDFADEFGKRVDPAFDAGEPRRIRLFATAVDRMDGNPERRRLGLYRLGFAIIPEGLQTPSVPEEWRIVFDRIPDDGRIGLVYGPGSVSGATGPTTFTYIVSNRSGAEGTKEEFLPLGSLPTGRFTLRVFAGDFFGNITLKDIGFTVGQAGSK